MKLCMFTSTLYATRLIFQYIFICKFSRVGHSAGPRSRNEVRQEDLAPSQKWVKFCCMLCPKSFFKKDPGIHFFFFTFFSPYLFSFPFMQDLMALNNTKIKYFFNMLITCFVFLFFYFKLQSTDDPFLYLVIQVRIIDISNVRVYYFTQVLNIK